MKIIYFTIAWCLVSAFSYTQEVNHLEYYSEFNFESTHNIGQKHVLVQYCIPDIDSVVSNGSVTFNKTKFSSGLNCAYRVEFKDTIINCLIFKTKSSSQIEKLEKYAKSTCDKFEKKELNKKEWYYIEGKIINGKNCVIYYYENRKTRKAFFEIKLAEGQ